MLSTLLLFSLSTCNAQWSEQNIGYDNIGQIVALPEQFSDPYDESSYWIQNIPNINLPNIPREKPQLAKTFFNSNFKLPEYDSQKIKTILKVLEFLTSSIDKSYDNVKSINQNHPLKYPEFPISSGFSQIAENVELRNKSSVRDSVTSLANQKRSLRNETDELVGRFDLLYTYLAKDESGNEINPENLYKYGMSLILRFLIEFYRIFRKMSSQPTQLRLANVDIYDVSYDKAIVVMKEKRSYSPLEMSTPIKRSAEILQSILYESITIVQTKCNAIDPNWKCVLVYLANLISESTNCSNVWYHALMHLLALEKMDIRDSFVYKIAILDKFKQLSNFENIFDFVLEKIDEYREVGKIQLSAEAIIFTMLADLQESGLLDCISLDYLWN